MKTTAPSMFRPHSEGCTSASSTPSGGLKSQQVLQTLLMYSRCFPKRMMHTQPRQVVADFCCMHLSLEHLQIDVFGPMSKSVVCHATHMPLPLQTLVPNLFVCTNVQGAESAAWEVLPAKGRPQKPMTRQHSPSGQTSSPSFNSGLSIWWKELHPQTQKRAKVCTVPGSITRHTEAAAVSFACLIIPDLSCAHEHLL